MEFYSAIKKNEILSFVSKWMELENIISEIKPKGSCFLSHVEYRPNTNTSNIMKNMSHEGWSHMREGREKEGS
jgi:hypothetical protein